MMQRRKLYLWTAILVVSTTMVGCSDDDIIEVPVDREVRVEVPVDREVTVEVPVNPAPVAFTMQLLHFSDMDGSDTTALGSVANFSGLVQKFRNEFPNNTLTVSSGDNFIPGPRLVASADPSMRNVLGREGLGRADIELVNSLGVQASAVGNHDLDLGTAALADMIAANGDWRGAQFPYLSYNVDFSKDSGTSRLASANGQTASQTAGKLTGWVSINVAGERVGVIGASSPTFKSITNVGSLEFTPALTTATPDVVALAANIQKGVDEIKAAGINKVVLLAHMQQIAVERQLATLLDGVDIVVAGGSNTLLANTSDVLRQGDSAAGTYPQFFTSKSGEPVALVNTDADYKYLGRFMAAFDAEGRLIRNIEFKQTGAQVSSQTSDTAGGVTPIARVVEVRNALQSVIAAKDGNIFGRTSVFLDGRRATVRNEESNFGNLTADANLWYAQRFDPTAQISLKNGGGIRDQIGELVAAAGSTAGFTLAPPIANPAANRAAGQISELAIENALRFDNKLWVFDVTAAQLKVLLEHSVASLGNQGRFPQVGGLAFSYDATRPAQVSSGATVTTAGQRIRSLRVGSDVVVRNGELVGNQNRTFRLVTLSFLAGGGDGFPFPVEASLPNLVKLEVSMTAATAAGAAVLPSTNPTAFGGEQDALAKYLRQFHTTTPFSMAEVPAAQDTRIQNVAVRADTVLN